MFELQTPCRFRVCVCVCFGTFLFYLFFAFFTKTNVLCETKPEPYPSVRVFQVLYVAIICGHIVTRSAGRMGGVGGVVGGGHFVVLFLV